MFHCGNNRPFGKLTPNGGAFVPSGSGVADMILAVQSRYGSLCNVRSSATLPEVFGLA
jgi:hypothetical protein